MRSILLIGLNLLQRLRILFNRAAQKPVDTLKNGGLGHLLSVNDLRRLLPRNETLLANHQSGGSTFLNKSLLSLELLVQSKWLIVVFLNIWRLRLLIILLVRKRRNAVVLEVIIIGSPGSSGLSLWLSLLFQELLVFILTIIFLRLLGLNLLWLLYYLLEIIGILFDPCQCHQSIPVLGHLIVDLTTLIKLRVIVDWRCHESVLNHWSYRLIPRLRLILVLELIDFMSQVIWKSSELLQVLPFVVFLLFLDRFQIVLTNLVFLLWR